MPVPSLHDTLQRIEERLSQGLIPKHVIEELLPQTRTDALTWARHLPGWEEYAGQHTAQVITVARIISLRAMHAYNLKLSEDGRVVRRQREGPPWQTPKPSLKFRLVLQGEEVLVAYTPGYFPDGRTDYFYFVSPHDPVRPHCLSETGHLSQLAPYDAVEACGGPEAYAARFAEARLRGEDKEFDATFEGRWPESKQPRRQKGSPPAPPPTGEQLPAVGKHTAQEVAEQEAKQATRQPPRQRTLFDELP